MVGQYDQLIFRYKLQVILYKVQLILPEAAPVTFPVTRIRIKYIIQDNEVGIRVVKCIIGGAEIGFKSFI
ncbi:hypothetical protein FQZ97_822230 [compost metagenome]